MRVRVEGWTRAGLRLGLLAATVAAGCGDSTAPEEARFPIVEGIYNVDTSLVSNSCRTLAADDGGRIYVFVQDGGRLEFRPPGVQEGRVVLLDLGIRGELEPDGSFAVNGTYTLRLSAEDPGLVVGFSMEGRFIESGLEGVEHHRPTFPGGSCEATFSFTGEEV